VAKNKRERDKLARMARAFDRIDRLLFDLVQQGLQRLSTAVVDELAAAQRVAHNASLVNLERELAALGTVAERYLERDPLFRPMSWLGNMHRARTQLDSARSAWSLDADLDALEQVVGTARRKYRPMAEPLEVQAVAAVGWVTDSDFVGLTVHLQQLRTGALFQASLARPTLYFGIDPRVLLYQDLSDHYALTPQDLAHGAWVMHGARVSADHRVSLHRDLVVKPGPWQGASAYRERFAPDWLALVDRLRTAALEGRNSELVYIEPVEVSRPDVDDKHARARARMSDGNGAWLHVDVPLDAHRNLLVDNLQLLTADAQLRPDGWFGRASLGGGALRFEPWTALYRQPMVLSARGRRQVHALHLTLESAEQLAHQ
jgi:hypothetical protein